MKNINKIRYSVVALLLATGLLWSGSAMADADFFSSQGANLKSGTWLYGDGMDKSGVPIKELGFKKTLSITEMWAKVWQDTDKDYFTGVTFKYKIDGGTEKSVNLSGGSWSDKKQTWSYNGTINIATSSTTPGDHKINFYFVGTYYWSNSYAGLRYFSNGSQNYQMNYTVPGFIGKSVDFGTVRVDSEVSTEYQFSSYGWASCTATITGTGKNNFSFRSDSYASDDDDRTKSIDIDDNKSPKFNIYFKPTVAGDVYTATLTLSGTLDGEVTPTTKTYNLTGKGLSGDILVKLANPGEPQDGWKALLSGYLKSTGCNAITEYGFLWGTTSKSPATGETHGDGDVPSTFNYGSSHSMGTLPANTGAATQFEYTLTGLSAGTYYYRAYAKSSSKYAVSAEGSFKLEYECIYPDPVDDFIHVTIDHSQTTSKCDLRFNSIGEAITCIKGVGKYYDSNKLKCNVVFDIKNTKDRTTSSLTYKEATEVGNVTGGSQSKDDALTHAKCIMIQDFNYNSPDKRLYLRGTSRTDRATLQHLVLRTAKNISVENLIITGDVDTGYGGQYDNAIDIDNANAQDTGDDKRDWLAQNIGDIANADIRFRGCYIKSKGFTCLHISAYDGLTMEDCDIDADNDDGSVDNVKKWGSSIKIIHCKNIKLLRNNFRGSHATSTWIQSSDHILIMNNVYWNDNDATENVAFIRLVYQGGGKEETVGNVGIYYNTLYLADNATNSERVDFFRLGSWYNTSISGNADKYDASTIEFKYNNCYSYDKDVPGRNLDAAHTSGSDGYPFLTSTKLTDFCGKIDFNNFWSQYDEKLVPKPSESNFNIKPTGCAGGFTTTSRFIDVSKAVCETASSDPSSLVLKTNALNLGSSVSSDVSGLGAASIYSDRLHENAIRPNTSTSGGGTSKAGSEGANGTITLTVNDNITSASKDIDLKELGFTGNYVTVSLSGTNSTAFTPSTADGGTIDVSSTKVFSITFSKGSLSKQGDPYTATLTFTGTNTEGSSPNRDSDRSISINLKGYYNTDTPIEGGWTLGAYQMSHGEKVDIIVWNGGTEKDVDSWDNRNNWRKLDGSYVTCVDLLAENLKVIIPAPEKVEGENDGKGYPRPESGKISYYPVMPEFFNKFRKLDESGEVKYGDDIVNAGQNIDGVSVSKYAHSIEIQSGGALKGAEYLHREGVRHYDEASTQYISPRKRWLLVGTVVQPFKDGKKNSVRYVKSGDYYLDKLPQVYMHEAKSDGSSWNNSFASLDKEVEPDKVFAVLVADEYGKYKLTASRYNSMYKTSYDGSASISFAPFVGWFYNESELPEYVGAGAGNVKLVCNTYPANIDIEQLIDDNEAGGLAVHKYNEVSGSFEVAVDGEILSQNGFGIECNDGYNVVISTATFSNGETAYRNAAAEIPSIRISLTNNAISESGSNVLLRYDHLKTDEFRSGKDASKIFIETNGFENVPDIYAMRYTRNLSGLTVPTLEEPLPLGVKVKKTTTVKFGITNNKGFTKAVLTDIETGIKTDLLTDSYSVELATGSYEERFYLNLEVDNEIITTVKESNSDTEEDDSISIIYANGRASISSTNGVSLKEAYISDMSGKTYMIKLKNAHYNDIKINGAGGVYIIKVVGDVMNKTEKVIVK